MFVGKLGFHHQIGNAARMRSNVAPAPMAKAQTAQNLTLMRRTDHVEISRRGRAAAEQHACAAMAPLPFVPYTTLAPDERLSHDLLAPSEMPPLSEKDAVLKQFMKQYRLEGHFEGDRFVSTSDSGKIRLPDDVTDSELETFRQQLVRNGLGQEIDWRGVEDDLANMDMSFSNMEHFEAKADFLASRYAVLKDRIGTQFTGDQHDAEMAKLESLFSQYKETIANSFAETVGGFYEGLGQTGTIEEMKASVLVMIDQKASGYEKHLAQAGDYAQLEGSENQWLKQDDAYLASKLREHVSAVSGNQKPDASQTTTAPYSAKDLVFAGMYAAKTSEQITKANWDYDAPDASLGEFFAQLGQDLERPMYEAGVGDRFSALIQNSFRSFMDRYMDTLDHRIKKNQAVVERLPHMAGSLRTELIDREAVYRAFQKVMVQN